MGKHAVTSHGASNAHAKRSSGQKLTTIDDSFTAAKVNAGAKSDTTLHFMYLCMNNI